MSLAPDTLRGMRAALFLVLGLALGCGAGDGLPACRDGLALQRVSIIDGLGNPPPPEQTALSPETG